MTKLVKTSLEDAETVYQAYPRHVGKRGAIKAIEKAIQRLIKGEYKGRELSLNEALAGLKNRAMMFANSPAGNKGSFTPHPATWFNRSSYLDDPEEWKDERPNDSKQLQRANNNARAVAAAMFGAKPPGNSPDHGQGLDARGNRSMERVVKALLGS